MDFKSRYIYNPREDLIGRGGFARVYKAQDILLDRTVAIKVFNKVDNGHYTVLEEIKKVIRFEHPNLLRYYDVALLQNINAFGEKEELQIGIMELANAGDLKTFVQGDPKPSVIIDLLKQVLYGLDFLHQKSIVHRDLKPQNILLVNDGSKLIAKISDFGISRNMEANTNSASMTIGTIEYMAPEQFSPAKYGINGKISTNVDLWSFGIMLYELLATEPPFGQRSGNTTAEQIMNSILSAELPQKLNSIEEPFKTVIKKCLVSDAKLRVQSAKDLIPFLDASYTSIPAVDAFETQFINFEEKNNPTTTLSPTLISDKTDSTNQLHNIDNANTHTFHLAKTPHTEVLPPDSPPVGNDSITSNKTLENQAINSSPVAEETPTIPPREKPLLQEAEKPNHSTNQKKSANTKIRNIAFISLIVALGGGYYVWNMLTQNFYAKIDSLLEQHQYDQALTLLNDKTQAPSQRKDSLDTQYLVQTLISKGDTSAAIPFLKQELEWGSIGNAYLLGQLYYTGKFVEQDYQKAKHIFEKIPTDNRAVTMLGNIHFMGLGVSQNFTKALGFYQKAAAQGNSVAMYSLGLAYLNGAGIKQDKQKALDWFYKVIQKNDNVDASNAAKSQVESMHN